MLGMFDILPGRATMLVTGTLALSLAVSIAWGYKQQSGRVQAEKRLLQSERDYQARIAEALDKQRRALDAAILAERGRRIDLENKWKKIEQANKETADYEKTAPASIINTLNSLSDRNASR